MPADGIPLLPSAKLMSADEVYEIAEQFVKMGVNKIRLTGGEPLVRKDFEAILRKLATLDAELAISSNGILIDKYIPLFKEVGLKKINLSLDSLKPEKFHHITRRDHFNKVMQNLQLLLSKGFEVKINVVLMRNFNEDEIIDFIAFTETHNVDVRLIEFMPFDGNNWNSDKLIPLKEITELAGKIYGDRLQKLVDDRHDTTKNFQVKGFKGRWGVISTVTSPFCSGCNRMRLTADGKMKNCLFDNNEMDLLTAVRNNQPFEHLIKLAVWKKHAVRGGMDTAEKFSDETLNQENRSMIAIGG
jgi:cyclic pyranopterin phosphate synthase